MKRIETWSVYSCEYRGYQGTFKSEGAAKECVDQLNDVYGADVFIIKHRVTETYSYPNIPTNDDV